MARQSRKKPVKYYSAKRRAIYEAGDDIDHLTLFEMMGWTCYVCKEPVDRRLRFPNYMAATVEHVIPLCKGGTHTWDNVSMSHARCNFERGSNI